MATIKDVAKRAGVSVGTVSKVLNGVYVRDANRLKVEEAISQLNYQVNTYARGMKAQFTNTVALILPDLVNPFFALLTNYVEQELFRKNYRMVLCLSSGSFEKEQGYFAAARQNKIDGIIGLTYSDEAEKYVSDDMPLVSIDRYYEAHIPCVTSDNYQGGVIAARHFYRTGCHQVAYFRTGAKTAGSTLERDRGFLETSRELGMECVHMDFGEEPGAETADQIFQYLREYQANTSRVVEGIFFSSDDLAVMTVEKLRREGIRIPEDVQIIGYDGLTVLNRGPLYVSSIRQPIQEMARCCVEQVMRVIHREPAQMLTVLPVEFAEGGTTRPQMSGG